MEFYMVWLPLSKKTVSYLNCSKIICRCSKYFFTGILGLWSGLVPRLLGEAITIGITAGLTYYINQYVDNNMKAHTTTFAGTKKLLK